MWCWLFIAIHARLISTTFGVFYCRVSYQLQTNVETYLEANVEIKIFEAKIKTNMHPYYFDANIGQCTQNLKKA
jgi:hypothetical protein